MRTEGAAGWPEAAAGGPGGRPPAKIPLAHPGWAGEHTGTTHVTVLRAPPHLTPSHTQIKASPEKVRFSHRIGLKELHPCPAPRSGLPVGSCSSSAPSIALLPSAVGGLAAQPSSDSVAL